MTIWINAFIPSDAPGTIDGVGASAGHRVLQGPVSWFNDCFWTDNRGFSSGMGASSRMQSRVVVDLDTGAKVHEEHHCGATHECDCEDGDIECTATAGTGGMHWTDTWWHDHDTIAVSITGAASNPCFSGAPEIDYTGTYWITPSARLVQFQGSVNGFPAYESYCQVEGGVHTIFTYGPRGTAADLMGGATDGVTGSASY